MKKKLWTLGLFAAAVACAIGGVACDKEEENKKSELPPFVLNEAGDGYVTRYYNLWHKKGEEVVEIPSAYNGLPVTEIGENTFASNIQTLTKIIIPDTVTKIGKRAFSDNMTVTEIVIPDSVTYIDDGVFSGCINLKSLTIPDSVTYVGKGAFSHCMGLESLYMSKNVEYLGLEHFDMCDMNKIAQWEDGVGYIGKWALDYDGSVAEVSLREDTVGISQGIFIGETTLTGITFNDSLRYMGSFRACANLTGNIVIPDGVREIPDYAFLDTSITGVNLGEGLTRIGDFAFNGCETLAGSIVVPEGIAYIGKNAFYHGKYTELVLPESYVLEDSMIFVSDALSKLTISLSNLNKLYFSPEVEIEDLHINGGTELTREEVTKKIDVSKLKKLTLGDSVQNVAAKAFEGCVNLIELDLGNGVQTIGEEAFDGIKAQSLTIPSNVRTIADYAFFGSDALTQITIAEGVQTIGEFAFSNNRLIQLFLPASLIELDDTSFLSNGTLQSVSVAAENTVYYSQDGILYNKAKTEYVIIPVDIGGEVVLPEGVTYVAFSGATRLTSVSIPSTVEYLNDYAFYNCSSLTTVYYAGTEGQWGALEKGEDWNVGAGNFTLVFAK